VLVCHFLHGQHKSSCTGMASGMQGIPAESRHPASARACLVLKMRWVREAVSLIPVCDHDVFHNVFHDICLCMSPDKDGRRSTICFTICLFISPDLDGHRAPKNGSLDLDGSVICFTICLFISPDLDGHRFHDMFVH